MSLSRLKVYGRGGVLLMETVYVDGGGIDHTYVDLGYMEVSRIRIEPLPEPLDVEAPLSAVRARPAQTLDAAEGV